MSQYPITHIEISALDREAASKFYADIFGWQLKHIPEMNYTTFTTGPGHETGGGFNPVSEENPAGTVLVYIETPDVDASLAAIEAHGGKVLVPRTEIPGMGWFGVFNDPTGNTLALFQSLPASA